MRDLSEIKNINSKINGNLDETIEISDLVRTKPDKEQRHSKFNIKNFDTREVNIYDPDSQQAYILKLSIAELNNGEKVGYAKKTLEPNETLTKTIKKETLTSSASKNGRHSRSDVSTKSIPPTQQNVNDNTKYSIEESENNSDSFSMDNRGRKLSKEQQEYFKNSKVRDENNNLLTMYHSTDSDFNTFSYDNLGKTGLAYGEGFYFTDSEKAKNAYGNNTKTVYLDISKTNGNWEKNNDKK